MARRESALGRVQDLALVVIIAIGFGACDGAEVPGAPIEQPRVSIPDGAPAPLSDVQMEQGIGQIRDLQLDVVDIALAKEGESSFKSKCSACHKLEERYVAPMLGDVLDRRRPEFVMNMILNATEMVNRHPDIQSLLAEYFVPMPVQVTDETEARAILEYLRSSQVSTEVNP